MNQKRRRSSTRGIANVALGSFLLAFPFVGAPAEAQTDGAQEYQNFCAVCHGVAGRGDGPMASQLIHRPSDLTTLSAMNGGSFPETVVYQIIDGRRIVFSHGTREMPIWGDRFSTHSDATAADTRVSALVSHLERIQRKCF